MVSKEDGIRYAREMEVAYRTEQKRNNPFLKFVPESCTGKQLYGLFSSYFKKLDERLFPILTSANVSPEEYFKELGKHLYETGAGLSKSKTLIRSFLGKPDHVKFIVAKLLKQKRLVEYYREIMRSILMSIKYLGLLTARKCPGRKPSQLLQFMIANKTVQRYLGRDMIDFHFLAGIPVAEELMRKNAVYHVDPLTMEKRMDPEYKAFLDGCAMFRQESKAACKMFGLKQDGLLDALDTYYFKNKESLLAQCLNP